MEEHDMDTPADIGAEVEEASEGATLREVQREQLGQLVRSPGFLIGSAVLLFWILAAIFPGLLTSIDPKQLGTGDIRPGGEAWFGTDSIGRDVYSRVIFGARPIMIVAPIAAGLAVIVGTLLGLAAGYYLGWFDEVISRFAEAVLSVPAILMAILIIVTFGASRPVIIGTVAVLFVPPVLRTVRAAALSEARLDYVTSAKMRGENSLFIIAREILPNVIGVTVVEFTVRIGYAIFTVATLAFLGIIGDNATNADWGVDVNNTFSRIPAGFWWPTIFPALAIASLVISVNLIADSIEEALSS